MKAANYTRASRAKTIVVVNVVSTGRNATKLDSEGTNKQIYQRKYMKTKYKKAKKEGLFLSMHFFGDDVKAIRNAQAKLIKQNGGHVSKIGTVRHCVYEFLHKK